MRRHFVARSASSCSGCHHRQAQKDGHGRGLKAQVRDLLRIVGADDVYDSLHEVDDRLQITR